MSDKIKIGLSLVIPIYNEEVLVKDALDNVITLLEHDFEDYEIILVDDGSKDKTAQIIEDHYANHPRVVFIKNYINLNQGVTVQRGFGLCTKELVTFNGIDLPLDIASLKKIISAYQDEDILVLQRMVYSGATKWRLITSNVNILIRSILFPKLSRGFKDMNFTQIYRNDKLKDIMPLAKSPAFTTPELLFRAKIKNYKIKCINIEFQSRKHGKGSLGKFHDIVWTIYDMLRFRYLCWLGIDKHGKVK